MTERDFLVVFLLYLFMAFEVAINSFRVYYRRKYFDITIDTYLNSFWAGILWPYELMNEYFLLEKSHYQNIHFMQWVEYTIYEFPLWIARFDLFELFKNLILIVYSLILVLCLDSSFLKITLCALFIVKLYFLIKGIIFELHKLRNR